MIVYPVLEVGGRLVRVDGHVVGTAYSLDDLSVFLCRAGIGGWTVIDLMAEDVVESAAELIDWRGAARRCGSRPQGPAPVNRGRAGRTLTAIQQPAHA
ncbi:hypothetical protein [Streptomyces sp. MBT84]|uniref:hypothetical protein n=1 Tax=Streptomyces sp. MBT84 TaxID=1488414 RepID=UPI0027E20E7B|nr:hypothetical protein [Streptomyces sp. MBT84]